MFEFADEIGGTKAAVRGVGMGVTEAVGLGSGGGVGVLASHGESIAKVNSIDK